MYLRSLCRNAETFKATSIFKPLLHCVLCRKKWLEKKRMLLKQCVEGKMLIVVITNCPILSRMNGCENKAQTEKP